MKKLVAAAMITAILAMPCAVLGADVYLQIENSLAVSNNNILAVDPQNGSVQPIETAGRTLVPVRFTAEIFGADVLWNEGTSTVTLLTNESMTTIVIGSNIMTVEKGGQTREVELDVPAMLYQGRTFLPLRAIAQEALGNNVYWDENSRIIAISSDMDYTFPQEKIAQVEQMINGHPFSLEQFPVIESSLAAAPFSRALVRELTGVGENSAWEIAACSNADTAYAKLLNNETDLIFVTDIDRPEIGTQLEAVPFCKDAVVFLAHKSNPLTSLTTAQLQSIYQGKTTNFKEVGGRSSKITAYQQPAGSEIQLLAEKLVMQGMPMADAPKETITTDNGGMIEAVASYDNAGGALGYTLYSYANDIYSGESIKLLGVNAEMPVYASVKSEQYPLTVNYYAVFRKDEPVNSPARRVVEYVTGMEGQRLVEQCGLISM